jgi:hypothetical protein
MIFPSIALSFLALSISVVHATPPTKGGVNTDVGTVVLVIKGAWAGQPETYGGSAVRPGEKK